jgi:hypothetical protein
MGLITSAFKSLFDDRIDLLLEDNALTVPCLLVYGDTKYEICPNCNINIATNKSTGIYKPGGPVPFSGGICPFCNNDGRIAEIYQDSVYLALIFDSRDWIKWSKKSVSPHNPKMFVQSISKFSETYTKIKRAKYLIADTNVNDTTRSKYERYAEPTPIGLGNSNYVIAMWKKI